MSDRIESSFKGGKNVGRCCLLRGSYSSQLGENLLLKLVGLLDGGVDLMVKIFIKLHDLETNDYINRIE